MEKARSRSGLEEYLKHYGYDPGPLGPINYGEHVPPDLLDFCAEGVLKMEALSKHKRHIEECETCRRNFEAIFRVPYGEGPGKKSIPERGLPARRV